MFTAFLIYPESRLKKKHMVLTTGQNWPILSGMFGLKRFFFLDFQGCVLQIEDGWLIVTNWGFSRCMSIFCISYHIIFDRKFLMLLTSIFFFGRGAVRSWDVIWRGRTQRWSMRRSNISQVNLFESWKKRVTSQNDKKRLWKGAYPPQISRYFNEPMGTSLLVRILGRWLGCWRNPNLASKPEETMQSSSHFHRFQIWDLPTKKKLGG